MKPIKIDFEPRHRMKGKGKSGKVEKRKQGVKEERKRAMIKTIKSEKERTTSAAGPSQETKQSSDPMFKLFKKRRN